MASIDKIAMHRFLFLRTADIFRRHDRAAAALRKLLKISPIPLTCGSLDEVVLPQPWATTADGHIIGHLLEVAYDLYETALNLDRVVILPVHAALEEKWWDTSLCAHWTQEYGKGGLKLHVQHLAP